MQLIKLRNVCPDGIIQLRSRRYLVEHGYMNDLEFAVTHHSGRTLVLPGDTLVELAAGEERYGTSNATVIDRLTELRDLSVSRGNTDAPSIGQLYDLVEMEGTDADELADTDYMLERLATWSEA